MKSLSPPKEKKIYEDYFSPLFLASSSSSSRPNDVEEQRRGNDVEERRRRAEDEGKSYGGSVRVQVSSESHRTAGIKKGGAIGIWGARTMDDILVRTGSFHHQQSAGRWSAEGIERGRWEMGEGYRDIGNLVLQCVKLLGKEGRIRGKSCL